MLWWTMRKLRSTTPDVRNQAIEELAALGPRAVEPLIEAITNGDAAVREAAGVALVRIGEPAVTPLLKVLKAGHISGDIGLRMIQGMELSRVLASIGTPAIPHLLIALKDNDKYVRWAAVGALGLVRDPHLLEALLVLLNDTEPMVRSSAATAVGWFKDPSTIGALTSALQDENEYVRKAAAEALREMGGAEPAAVTRNYSNRQWEFDLDYPRDWNVQCENDAAGSWTVAVCIVGPAGTGGRPAIMVNARRGVVLEGGGSTGGGGITVITIGGGGQSSNLPKTARDYIEKSKQDLARSFSGFKFISGEEIQVAGRPAARMVYSYDGDTGRIQELCITRFGVMVTFQFTCEVPATKFEAVEPVFKKIIESFRLKS